MLHPCPWAGLHKIHPAHPRQSTLASLGEPCPCLPPLVLTTSRPAGGTVPIRPEARPSYPRLPVLARCAALCCHCSRLPYAALCRCFCILNVGHMPTAYWSLPCFCWYMLHASCRCFLSYSCYTPSASLCHQTIEHNHRHYPPRPAHVPFDAPIACPVTPTPTLLRRSPRSVTLAYCFISAVVRPPFLPNGATLQNHQPSETH